MAHILYFLVAFVALASLGAYLYARHYISDAGWFKDT